MPHADVRERSSRFAGWRRWTHHTLVLAAALTVTAGCSSDDDEEPQRKNRFADTGFSSLPDLGAGACSMAGCAQFEIITAAPECRCTNTCITGYLYNLVTSTCDAQFDAGFSDSDGGGPTPDTGLPVLDTGVDTGVDTGINVPDLGFEAPDAGFAPPDGGLAPGACFQDTDCPGSNDVCLNLTTGDRCNGAMNCGCFQGCDWAVPAAQAGCPAGAACAFLFGTLVDTSICVQDNGGGTQNQLCQATFDPQGNFLSDNCNNDRNFYCITATPQQPTGRCTRLCSSTNDRVCASFGTYTCEGIQTPGLGWCFIPPPNHTDMGRACPPTNCQSGLCAADLGGLCASSCEGLNQCQAGTTCVIGQTDGLICAVECTPGVAGDAACGAIQAGTVCAPLTGGGGVCVR